MEWVQQDADPPSASRKRALCKTVCRALQTSQRHHAALGAAPTPQVQLHGNLLPVSTLPHRGHAVLGSLRELLRENATCAMLPFQFLDLCTQQRWRGSHQKCSHAVCFHRSLQKSKRAEATLQARIQPTRVSAGASALTVSRRRFQPEARSWLLIFQSTVRNVGRTDKHWLIAGWFADLPTAK